MYNIMARIQFREIGGAYAAAHAIKGYYRATGQPYTPSHIRVQGKVLYADNVPTGLLENVIGKIEKGAKIKF